MVAPFYRRSRPSKFRSSNRAERSRMHKNRRLLYPPLHHPVVWGDYILYDGEHNDWNNFATPPPAPPHAADWNDWQAWQSSWEAWALGQGTLEWGWGADHNNNDGLGPSGEGWGNGGWGNGGWGVTDAEGVERLDAERIEHALFESGWGWQPGPQREMPAGERHNLLDD
ncbi:hypothetical protein C8R46DRAFT_1214535 [Mycena filopes]|nr:hypothetical protein C8R46DRAFT_1214535 [Mycena filopes]